MQGQEQNHGVSDVDILLGYSGMFDPGHYPTEEDTSSTGGKTLPKTSCTVAEREEANPPTRILGGAGSISSTEVAASSAPGASFGRAICEATGSLTQFLRGAGLLSSTEVAAPEEMNVPPPPNPSQAMDTDATAAPQRPTAVYAADGITRLEDLRTNDCLPGRGTGNYGGPGNQIVLNIVKENVDDFSNIPPGRGSKKAKETKINAILNILKVEGVRLLKKRDDVSWMVLNEKEAYERVIVCMRTQLR